MENDLYYRVSVKAADAKYDLSDHLSALTIDETGDSPDQLSLELNDPFKVVSHAVQEGMDVEVELGCADDHSLIFRGCIYRSDANFPAGDVPTLKLTAYDKSMTMGLRKRNRRWTGGITLQQIIQQVATAHFGASNIEINLVANPEFTGNGLRQKEQTDLRFLHELGAKYGFELFVESKDDKDILHCDSHAHIMSQDPEVTLFHGRCGAAGHLISFQASGNVSDIRLARVYQGIDPKDGRIIQKKRPTSDDMNKAADRYLDENLTHFREHDAEKADALVALIEAAPKVQSDLRAKLGGEERVTLPGFATDEELGELIKNQFSTSAQGMRGSGATVGNHRLHAQVAIDLEDLGGRFSGKWYLSEVHHIVNGEGYKSEFKCQR